MHNPKHQSKKHPSRRLFEKSEKRPHRQQEESSLEELQEAMSSAPPPKMPRRLFQK
jgi:hypothetical protein